MKNKGQVEINYNGQCSCMLSQMYIIFTILFFLFLKAMSEAMMEMYECVKERLRPCPSQAHYIFSLHDLSRIVQGIMLMSPRTRIKKAKVKRKEGEEWKK